MAGNPKRRQQEAELREVWDELCDMIAAGATDKQALEAFGVTSTVVFYRLVRNDETLAASLARAREAGADAMASEAVDIVDDLQHVPKADPVRVALARADRRAWLAGTRNQRYAPRAGGNVAVQVNVQALHLQALRAPALPAPSQEVIDVDAVPVAGEGDASLADLL